MTPDELLEQLRDIELPQHVLTGFGSSGNFSIYPYAALAIVVALVALIRKTRRDHWLRQARQALATLPRQSSDAEQAQYLLDLSAAISKHMSVQRLPDVGYKPLRAMNADDVNQLYQHLGRVLKR